MSTRTFVMVVALAVAPVAKGEVLVELIPDNPAPYTGGESLIVDVWLHSEVSFDVRLQDIQFDFSDSDPALALNPTLTFDYSSIPDGAGYHERHPELLVPWTANWLECVCPELFLPLPAGGSLHIGSIGLRLPTVAGAYRLDALNAAEPDPSRGAMLNVRGPIWRAFTGELTGGSFEFVVTPAIPTLSAWGTITLSLLLLGLGAVIIVRRHRNLERRMSACPVDKRRGIGADVRVIGICATAFCLGLPETLLAQPAPIPSEIVVVRIDSGAVSATGAGADPVVVHSEVVSVSGGPWMRLHFQQVQLSGSSSRGNESVLRITSLEDGAVQVLDSLALTRWGNTSAYFNGDAVLIELLAYPGTGANRVVIEKIVAGVQSELDSAANMCGDDNRVSSTDPRAGRIIPLGCTAFLFNDQPRCLLTAGHCPYFGGMDCVEFNVPLSDCDGSVNHPGPEDQYPIDQASIQYQITTDPFLGPGDDWSYFGVFDNTNTGLSPLEAQGASYQLVEIVPNADGTTLRITGYGLDKTPPGCCDAPACTTCGAPACGSVQRNEDSQTEQRDSGPYQAKVGTTVKYVIDTEGGSSGSAVEHVSDGLVYAIHTHGNCAATGVNKGTAVDHPGLQGALACPTGVCAEDGGGCCLPGGSCVETLDPCCTARGGTAQGPGTTCSPTGACCFPDDPCQVGTDECCTSAGGSFLGTGTNCVGAGACCLGGGSCNDLDECDCDAQGGNHLGAGTTCAATGACCLPPDPRHPLGWCVQRNECYCDFRGGLFQSGETCPYPCPTQQGPQHGG